MSMSEVDIYVDIVDVEIGDSLLFLGAGPPLHQRPPSGSAGLLLPLGGGLAGLLLAGVEVGGCQGWLLLAGHVYLLGQG